MKQSLKKKFSWFNTIYDVGIIIKGLDGLAELVAGVALLISPRLVHVVLAGIAGNTMNGHHSHTVRLVGEYVGRLDAQLAASGLAFLIIFLISHGIVKIVLVGCLLKKIVKVYPYALAVLGAFLMYQVYVFIREPSIGMALFSILDAVIIGLVWREYKMLLAEKVV